jgi:hypothetical protein
MYAGSAPQPSRETIDGSAVAPLSTAGVEEAVDAWAVVVTPSESPRTVIRASGRSVLTRTATAPDADSRAPYVVPFLRCSPISSRPADWGGPKCTPSDEKASVTCASGLPFQYAATLVAGCFRPTVAAVVIERTTRSDRVATWRGTEASAECSAIRLVPVRPTAKAMISSKRRSTGSSKRDQVDAPG